MDPEITQQFDEHREYPEKYFPALQSFRYRNFRWLWMGTFAFFMSISMQQITRGWLVLRLTDDSPLALSLVMMSFALPLTFASLFGGALADRLPKRQIMILSQSGYFLMVLTIATLDYTGLISFWHLIIIGIVNGTLAAFNMPSRNSMISEIVPENELMNAISLNNSGINLTRIIGPALAGVLILFLDTAGVFYLIAFINGVSTIFTSLIRDGNAPTGHKVKGVATEILDGFRYAKENPVLMGFVIISFVPALFGFPYIALLPAWSREALNANSDGLGLLMMVMGIGSLAGTLTLASIRRFKRRRLFLIVNGFVWGLALILFSRCYLYVTALPSLFFVGFTSSVFMALNMTLMQTYSSPEMRGRIVSMSMMTIGIMPLSALPFGALAESIGTPGSLQVAGIILCCFMVIFYFAHPRFRETPTS